MKLSDLQVLLAGVLWGLIALFVQALSSLGFSSLEIVAIRVSCTAAVFVLICCFREPGALKINFSDIPLFLGTGLVSIVAFNFCYFEAIELSAQVAIPALLLYTAPVFVMLLSLLLFKEMITPQKICALLMTLAGLVCVTGVISGGSFGTSIPLPAFLLGLGSGLGYGLYSIFSKYLLPRYSTLTITTWTFLVASVCAIPISGVWEHLSLLATFEGVLSALALAGISTVAPFLLYTTGLRSMEAGRAAILATVEPFVAAVVGIICYHEQLTLFKLAGMLCIAGAVVVLNLSDKS